MEKVTTERSRLLEENITLKRTATSHEERATELSRREADLAAAAAEAEAKHKSRIEQLVSHMDAEMLAKDEAIAAEQKKVAHLTVELNAARESGSVSMQKLLGMFQKTQLDFQAQLADEAVAAQVRGGPGGAEEEQGGGGGGVQAGTPVRTPLSPKKGAHQQFSESLSDIIKVYPFFLSFLLGDEYERFCVRKKQNVNFEKGRGKKPPFLRCSSEILFFIELFYSKDATPVRRTPPPPTRKT